MGSSSTTIWVCSGCIGMPVQSLDRGTHFGFAAWLSERLAVFVPKQGLKGAAPSLADLQARAVPAASNTLFARLARHGWGDQKQRPLLLTQTRSGTRSLGIEGMFHAPP
jgi:hypothetical protein